jgi:hypothetical protein
MERVSILRDAAKTPLLRMRERASYAGLTRVSITPCKSLTKKMDCRVKPGHDESGFVTP